MWHRHPFGLSLGYCSTKAVPGRFSHLAPGTCLTASPDSRYDQDMDRATAISILNLTPEPPSGWRYSWPTGQLVRMARRVALRAPRLPTLPTDAECNAVVEMFNQLDSRQAAARMSLRERALQEHEARMVALCGGSLIDSNYAVTAVARVR